MKEVEYVQANWINEAEYDNYDVEYEGIDKIEYHSPMGEGDKHYCDVIYSNGKIKRVFNLNAVVFTEKKEKLPWESFKSEKG
jgi:hypothetical protein